MPNKLNESALKKYSEDFSAQICGKYFANQDRISGQDILNVSPVKQVNLLVVKILFEKWNQEMEAIKSPYFDFDDDEVKKHLKEFMNALSRKISINRENFEGLLKEASSKSLHLLLEPADFFKKELKGFLSEHVNLTSFDQLIKYIKINENLYQKIIGNLDINQDEHAMIRMVDQLEENGDLHKDPIDPFLNLFSEVLPIKAKQFYLPEEPTPKTPKTIQESLFAQESSKATPSILEKLTSDTEKPLTLNEKLSKGADDDASMLKKLQEQQKISSLKQGISLNQKYMFINEFFDGNSSLYNDVIQEMDQLDDLGAAIKLFESKAEAWNQDSDEGITFLKILEKRF